MVTVPSMDKIGVVITVLAEAFSLLYCNEDVSSCIEDNINFREVDCQERTLLR